ncbi:MAG: Asp-tRNA(Asn)/Glu-tRNA(Gln) amidotransferase subunit GatC [Syntrophorhabdaceae bacterium]|nr:Asp-tRNA(Asn)/Glu-tRNA(Gln) amidotransferase subunit GatC [Syntrophorhabdaceae bacterium]MDD4196658.1 Asp-tRNA(Asn)/Glu-tRNA(Gln) amidotransferase subunit GatC [Syntrophorhabdaceae bacterium]
MKITKETVEYVAHLARLELSPDEVEAYTGQIDKVLEYMESLNSLNTDNVEPTNHPVPVACVMREDAVKPSFTAEESVGNAPRRVDTFFRVPPIMEQE